MKSGGNWAQASSGPLPVESHKTCLILFAMTYYYMCEILSHQRNSLKCKIPGFFLGSVSCKHPSTHACSKILGFRRKADWVQHKLFLLCQTIQVEWATLIIQGIVKAIWKVFGFPITSQGQPCTLIFLGIAVSALEC